MVTGISLKYLNWQVCRRMFSSIVQITEFVKRGSSALLSSSPWLDRSCFLEISLDLLFSIANRTDNTL